MSTLNNFTKKATKVLAKLHSKLDTSNNSTKYVAGGYLVGVLSYTAMDCYYKSKPYHDTKFNNIKHVVKNRTWSETASSFMWPVHFLSYAGDQLTYYIGYDTGSDDTYDDSTVL
jgi:hypothetical protein